jgi:hypothetical protein
MGIDIEPFVGFPSAGDTVPLSTSGILCSGGDAAMPEFPIGVAKKRFI